MKFKLLIISIIFIAFGTSLYSQNEPKTLFGNGDIRSSGYGGPEIKVTQVNGGEWGLLVGGRGGWIINSTFSIGGAGYGLVTNHKVPNYITIHQKEVYLRYGMGGLFLEYINSSDEIFHFTINSMIGAGGAVYTSKINEIINGNRDYVYESSAFFVFEPGATVDINLLRNFRIGLGASYRIISFLELPNTTNKDLGGVSVNLVFKFGTF
jgi:hypothetical protein